MEVKKGYPWSDQLGIVIAALIDADQEELVNWTKDVSGVLWMFLFSVIHDPHL